MLYWLPSFKTRLVKKIFTAERISLENKTPLAKKTCLLVLDPSQTEKTIGHSTFMKTSRTNRSTKHSLDFLGRMERTTAETKIKQTLRWDQQTFRSFVHCYKHVAQESLSFGRQNKIKKCNWVAEQLFFVSFDVPLSSMSNKYYAVVKDGVFVWKIKWKKLPQKRA